GEQVKVKAEVADPDGDEVELNWWIMKVGTYEGEVTIDSVNTAETSLTIPADAKSGDTIHLLLKARDKGTPALTRYLRTVITVK
nr:hypothetical protein [Bacteroidaceae bacterium]